MKTILTSLFVLVSCSLFAAAPIISYSGPKVYTVGTAITSLTPTNTGGAASVFGTVSTVGTSGSGQAQALTFNADKTILYVPLDRSYKVMKIAMPYTLSLLAGSGVKGSANGIGTAAQFSMAYGIAVHPISGDIYVAESDSNMIKKINPTTGEVTTYAGIKGKPVTIDGNISVAKLNTPRALAFDESGNLYVAQTGGGAIRKISADGTTVSTLVQTTTADGVTTTYFTNPWGMAYHNGFLYVTEVGSSTAGHKVSKVDIASGLVTVFAGSGTLGFADGTGIAAQFSGPRGIVVDANGIVYVADYSNNKIRKITTDGVVTTIAGAGTNNVSTDGIGAAAAFRSPAGLTCDGMGNLYVADAGSSLIRKVAVDVNPNANPYSVSPALPAGLTLNTQTGVISGKPTAEALAADYTITATNATGSSQAILNLTVNLASGLGNVLTNPLIVSANKNSVIRIQGEVGKNATATLFDIQGKMMLNKTLIEGNLNVVSTPGFKNGLYLLSVKDNTGSQMIKVLLQ
jgi:mucin-19